MEWVCGHQYLLRLSVAVIGSPSFKVSLTADDNLLDAFAFHTEGDILIVQLDAREVSQVQPTRLETVITMPARQTVSVSAERS